eukprot:TRINITY_DN82775_c0_g1_i1.p1 TRINITY_DN82775_c0_g1~~TRINITY_DN82775_c0_g1_i1.p1  ORF type:complete len:695 (-),score=146.17 TRINITY_DN82775_c0_g1_i1:78-2162(-)
MIFSRRNWFLLFGIFLSCAVASYAVEEQCPLDREESSLPPWSFGENGDRSMCWVSNESPFHSSFPSLPASTPPCLDPTVHEETSNERTQRMDENVEEEQFEESFEVEDVPPGKNGKNNVLSSAARSEDDKFLSSSSENSGENDAEESDVHIHRHTYPQAPKQPLSHRSHDIDFSIRMNFASSLLGAKVLEKNPGSMGARNLLNDDRDKYLLNVCNKNHPHYAIVELSQEILLDTIVLANYEYYASGLKNFRLYGSRSYPCTEPSCNWKWIGDFQLNNTRHSQAVFPNSKHYVQFLRIEFLSYYGNEFYCTLSTFRVHGSTLLEDLNEGEHYDSLNEDTGTRGNANGALAYRSSGGTDYVMIPRHMMQTPYAITDQESLEVSLKSFRPDFEDITMEDSSTENVFKRMLQRIKRLETNQNILKHSLEHWGDIWGTSIRRLMNEVAILRTDRAIKSDNMTKLTREFEALTAKTNSLESRFADWNVTMHNRLESWTVIPFLSSITTKFFEDKLFGALVLVIIPTVVVACRRRVASPHRRTRRSRSMGPISKAKQHMLRNIQSEGDISISPSAVTPRQEPHTIITGWTEPREILMRRETRKEHDDAYPRGRDELIEEVGMISFLQDQESEEREMGEEKTQLYENKMIFSVPEFGTLRRNEMFSGISGSGLDMHMDMDSDDMSMADEDADTDSDGTSGME